MHFPRLRRLIFLSVLPFVAAWIPGTLAAGPSLSTLREELRRQHQELASFETRGHEILSSGDRVLQLEHLRERIELQDRIDAGYQELSLALRRKWKASPKARPPGCLERLKDAASRRHVLSKFRRILRPGIVSEDDSLGGEVKVRVALRVSLELRQVLKLMREAVDLALEPSTSDSGEPAGRSFPAKRRGRGTLAREL